MFDTWRAYAALRPGFNTHRALVFLKVISVFASIGFKIYLTHLFLVSKMDVRCELIQTQTWSINYFRLCWFVGFYHCRASYRYFRITAYTPCTAAEATYLHWMQADSCSLLSFISKLEFGYRGGSAGIGAANNDAFGNAAGAVAAVNRGMTTGPGGAADSVPCNTTS